MAKVCYFTGRRSETGNTRSHALNANRRTWKPNLQKVRVSTRALKSCKVERV